MTRDFLSQFQSVYPDDVVTQFQEVQLILSQVTKKGRGLLWLCFQHPTGLKLLFFDKEANKKLCLNTSRKDSAAELCSVCRNLRAP